MKVKKAIEILKNLNFCERCANLGSCNCEEVKALRLAIKALKKSNSRKPVYDDGCHSCPNCEVEIEVTDIREIDVCRECYQRLDWRNL